MVELKKNNLYTYYSYYILIILVVLLWSIASFLLFFARAWRAWQCQPQCHCQGPTLLNLACQSTQVNRSFKMQIKVLLRSSCGILKQLLSSFHQMSHYISTISLQEVSSRSMYSILASKPLKIPRLSRTLFIQISIMLLLTIGVGKFKGLHWSKMAECWKCIARIAGGWHWPGAVLRFEVLKPAVFSCHSLKPLRFVGSELQCDAAQATAPNDHLELHSWDYIEMHCWKGEIAHYLRQFW